MKGYPKYKRSGILWFGDIPESWRVTSFKHVLKKIYGGGTPSTSNQEFWADWDDELALPWVAISDISNSNGVLLETNKKITELGVQDKNLEIIPKGTLLISIFASLGKTTILGIDATVNQAILGLEPNNALNPDFMKYILVDAERYVSYYSSSNTQDNLNTTKIKNLNIPIPSISEQTQIAVFLDHHTSLIDALIAKKEALMEKLKHQRQAIINEVVTGKKVWNPSSNSWTTPEKTKDSGIEWLGEIPEGWELVKLKNITQAFGRIGFRGYTNDDIVPEGEGAITLSPSNMKGDFMTFQNNTYISWEKYFESPEIQIENGDVLFVKTGSTYGKVGFVKDLNEKATINPQILVFKNIKLDAEYFYNLLRTPFIQAQVETSVIGSTIPTISQSRVLNFTVPIPNSDEVERIKELIIISSDKIDVTVKKVLIQIEKLKLYRQSLISEAVTGKIDVREWKAVS